MKKVLYSHLFAVLTAFVTMLLCVSASAADAAKQKSSEISKPVAAEKKISVALPSRPQMTPEQRSQLREQRMRKMAERRAALEAKQLEIVRKYISDETKAKALLEELKAARMPVHRVPAAKVK